MESYLEHLPAEEPDRFRLLAHARRRELIRLLDEIDSPVSLDDLVRELVVQEREVPASEIDREQFRQCKITLYHRHLPRLADADVVEFDADRRIVAPA